MSAVLGAEPLAVEKALDSWKKPVPPQLARYAFKPGQVHVRSPGRPKGSKSFSTVLIDAAPKLGKAYLRAALKGSAPLLIDTRKIFMPIESDAPAAEPSVLVWLERQITGAQLPGSAAPQPLVAQAPQNPQLSVTPCPTT